MLDSALQHLRHAGLRATILPTATTSTRAPDAVVELAWGNAAHTFEVEMKKGLRPSTAGLHYQRALTHQHPLLVGDRITGKLAALARDMNLPHADTAGNAWISTPDFLIDIQGRQPARDATTSLSQPISFTRTDLRVVLALASAPRLATATSRELGAVVGVSHGAAHQTVAKLRQLGHLTSRGLRHGDLLLQRWTEAYLARGGFQQSARTLFVDPDLSLATALAEVPDTRLGGEFAAELLGWPIRPASALVYTTRPSEVARHLRGRSTPPGLPVEIRTPTSPAHQDDPRIAPSMLLRADMLASMDARQIEVAQEALTHDTHLQHLREIP